MEITWFYFRIFLKPGIYRFSGSASLLALSVFVCDRKRGYGGHFDLLIQKFLVNAITWKIIIGSLKFFHVKLPTSMEMTWLDLQLSTDKQNGRHLATNFFSTYFFIFSEFLWNLVCRPIVFRGLRVYWHCPFSCETENEAASAILLLSILIKRFYFQLNALKPDIVFRGLRVYWHCPFSCTIQTAFIIDLPLLA